MLCEFERYRELLMNPAVVVELQAEREQLLAQVAEYLRSLRDEFDSRRTQAGGAPDKARVPVTESVARVLWAKQLESTVRAPPVLRERRTTSPFRVRTGERRGAEGRVAVRRPVRLGGRAVEARERRRVRAARRDPRVPQRPVRRLVARDAGAHRRSAQLDLVRIAPIYQSYSCIVCKAK